MTNLVGVDYWRLPEGMQQRDQWCLAGPDKAPYLASPDGLYRASPVQGPWLNFKSALQLAHQYGTGIGFIITETDPYTCIDLDVKDAESRDKTGQPFPSEQWTSEFSLAFYSGIMQFAHSYTELSGSRKGLHIWVEGDVGSSGKRGKGIEIYSKDRFIVCTGKPVSEIEYHIINGVVIPKITGHKARNIVNGDLIIENLKKELGANETSIELVEVDAELEDTEIWQRAAAAGNGDKFKALCEGQWQQYGFPSQSEADLALLSMLTFYTKSNEQCRRMFRQTALGSREKANKNDVYINRTLSLIRARQEREEMMQEEGRKIAAQLLTQKTLEITDQDLNKTRDYIRHTDQTQYSVSQPNTVEFKPPEVQGLEWPPGLVGAIAGFIYQSAPRPVKEVAIVSALGLMAGMTGKAYNVGQTGLNLYIILIARSAIGKEAMHSGIGHILRSPCGHVIAPFVNFTDYASGPALTKAMEGFSSFVNVSGEWGRKLQRMTDDRRDGPMQQLRTVMTHLYQKSGAASVVGGVTYSNKERNVDSVNAAAYSMIGETTPGTFYDSLTSTMMEDGFLSRFNIIEYEGDRPQENKNQLLQVPEQIHETLSSIASHCMSTVMRAMGNAIQIQLSEDSKLLLEQFNDYCDYEIHKAGDDESLRQVWNRAHLKAIRISGVLAASDNHITPVIQKAHALWAIKLIERESLSMVAKLEGGDVGIDDTSRFRKFQSIITSYLQGDIPRSYNIPQSMVDEGIVPRKFLQGRTSQMRCFKNYRLGATMGLDHTLKTAIDSGFLMEVDKAKMVQTYGYHGRCFRVLDTGFV